MMATIGKVKDVAIIGKFKFTGLCRGLCTSVLFIELVSIYYDKNLITVIPIHLISSKFNQASLGSKELAQILVC